MEFIEIGMQRLEEALMGKVNAKRQEEAKALLADIRYCANHMDATAYGTDFVHNLLVAAGLEKDFRTIGDGIVVKTLHVVLHRMRCLTTNRAEQDPECVSRRDTVLPGAKWIFRGYCCRVERCQHDYTVHFKCGVNGGAPRYGEVAQHMQQLIEECETL